MKTLHDCINKGGERFQTIKNYTRPEDAQNFEHVADVKGLPMDKNLIFLMGGFNRL